MFIFTKKILGVLLVKKVSTTKQYLFSILLIVLISVISSSFKDIIGYRVVALILLLVVSISAMLFDILPVLVTALLSAIILNFFFIPPTFTFHINTAEDVLMFVMYLVIALINGVLTFKIRQFERKKLNEQENKKTIQLYNTILNSLSHELRTPIAAIIGAIDTITDNEVNLSQENRKELYGEIELASNRLNRQVENLLSMSRLEAGTIRPTYDWFDINELVFTVIKENYKDASNHVIFFEPKEDLPLMKTDGGLIETILHNLIHNTLQHTSSGTRVDITASCQNCILSFTVSDSGNGFPKKERELVFNKFYKLKMTNVGGTGLGLSIVKGFTEALNGNIELGNSSTNGAKFTITIPVETSVIKVNENE